MRRFGLLIVALVLGGCGGATAPPLPSSAIAHDGSLQRHSVGLGKVLTSKSGQVFGYDIDQSGKDGVLATASDVETFDQDTGRITKSFPRRPSGRISFSADGIVAGDVGLITRYVTPKHSIYAKRFYDVMNPVTAKTFTGTWTPPVKDVQVEAAGPNQSTSTTAIFAIELKNQDMPILFASNVAKNTFGKVFALDPSAFSLGDQPQVAQDSTTGQAVIATSPDGGRVGGAAPINVLVDLQTGKQTQWNGLNNGPFGAGFVNGLAVDSATGVAATTTELNAQVEFYDLAQETGTATQLPCTGSSSQYNSGWGVTNDSVNGLFLVSAPIYCSGSQGSAIVVYDEKGDLVESITGFTMPIGVGGVAINPSKRMGWAVGPQINQLQQFFY
ncbi:MAG: hypothetical protein JO113_02175 [Candidatus Eremiobacteraeota bacterium]|nr:hypothetical protein [Candidatus Eremiobacteraeota bacterium]